MPAAAQSVRANRTVRNADSTSRSTQSGPLSPFVAGLVEVDREYAAKRTAASAKPAAPAAETGIGSEAHARLIQEVGDLHRQVLANEAKHRAAKPASPRPAPVVRPMPEWAWLVKPVNGHGYLQIGRTIYQVTEQYFEYGNGMGGRLWDLVKSDGAAYRLTYNADCDLACDCADAVYRGHELCCKHVLCLQAALNELNRLDRLNRRLAALEPLPADAPF
jgi:hypothetical protein